MRGGWIGTKKREATIKAESAAGHWHDYDGHLEALNAGHLRPSECWCLWSEMIQMKGD